MSLITRLVDKIFPRGDCEQLRFIEKRYNAFLETIRPYTFEEYELLRQYRFVSTHRDNL